MKKLGKGAVETIIKISILAIAVILLVVFLVNGGITWLYNFFDHLFDISPSGRYF